MCKRNSDTRFKKWELDICKLFSGSRSGVLSAGLLIRSHWKICSVCHGQDERRLWRYSETTEETQWKENSRRAPLAKHTETYFTLYMMCTFLLVIAHFSGWLFFSDSNERPSLIRILLIVKNRQFKKCRIPHICEYSIRKRRFKNIVTYWPSTYN